MRAPINATINGHSEATTCRRCQRQAEAVAVSFTGGSPADAVLCWRCLRQVIRTRAGQEVPQAQRRSGTDGFIADCHLPRDDRHALLWSGTGCPPRPPLQMEYVNGTSVVRFPSNTHLLDGRLDEVAGQLFNLLEQPGAPKTVLLNFGNVKCLGAAALGMLITLHKRVRALGGNLCLCNLSPFVREVFTITRLDTLLDIRDDEVRTLESF